MQIEKNLTHKLENAIKDVIITSINNNEVMPSARGLFIGTCEIVKLKDFTYSIIDLKTNKCIFKSISFFDAAYVIAKRISSNKLRNLKEILALEKEYQWYRANMIHYESCYQISTKNKDFERACILEDKMQHAKSMLKQIKDKMRLFRNLQ